MKKLQTLALVGLVLLTVCSCKQGKKETDTGDGEQTAETQKKPDVKVITLYMKPKSINEVAGRVVFREKEGVVVMEAAFSGLSEGEHAIYLHERADCSAVDGTSAGGYWNPTSRPHGKGGAKTEYHKGYIGNLMADIEGIAILKFETSEWCIGCDDVTKNIVGKAIIVHQRAGDYTSQPGDAAGARVACVGIIQ